MRTFRSPVHHPAAVLAALALVAALPAAADFDTETAIHGTVPFAELGNRVAVSGDTVLVGAPFEDCGDGFWCGSAEVWTKIDGVWTLEATLTPDVRLAFERYGIEVAVDGDRLAVGGNFSVTYVYERLGGVWTETAQIQQLNNGMALDGDTLVIAGLDVVSWVFDGIGWVEEGILAATDGVPGFGKEVALAGDRAVVGASSDDHAGVASGSAYVFDRAGGVWSQTVKLTASDASANSYYGCAVAVEGGTVLVGTSCPIISQRDAAYVYVEAGGTWPEEILTPAVDSNHFGAAVDLDGDRALIGAYQDESFLNFGAAFVFERSGGAWTETQKLTASTGGVDDELGFSVALDGPVAVAGAPGDDCLDGSFGCGAVFIFEESTPPLALGVTGTCPGAMTIEVTGATPDEPVAFLLADASGFTEIPPGAQCEGLVFDLDQPDLLGTLPADADGTVSVSRDIPSAACGKLLQAADGAACVATGVVTLE